MQTILRRLFPRQVHSKGILLEAALFVLAYVAWLAFRPSDSPSRALIGSVSALVPSVAAAILVFRSLPQMPRHSRGAWQSLGLGLVCWSVGNAVRTFYEAVLGEVLPVFSPADVFSFLFYPFLFYALVRYPFENRYAPSRFRFLLDVTILSGVVATLGWMILARSTVFTGLEKFIPLVYPIADLVLLMILVNMLLANRKSRRTLVLWGVGLLAILFADYLYGVLAPLGGYRAGGLESLGWMVGGLLFGIGAVVEANPVPDKEPRRRSGFDLGARIQNVLPLTFVLVLFWFVLADWQMSGRISLLGLLMSLLLSLALIVRVGVRAGEAELHKYWQLFSSLAEPAFICDERGRIVLGNPAFVRALGLQQEGQIIGKPLTSIFDDQAFPADSLPRPGRKPHSLEVVLRPKQTPYMLSLSPIFSEGRKILIAGAAHNLSDQKKQQKAIQDAYNELRVVSSRLEELNAQLELKVEQRTRTLSDAYRQLEEQNRMLQELDRLKSDFVSMVSHELRTPLTSLTGGLELLLERRMFAPSDLTTLSLMKKEVHRLTAFVENILNISATEAGRINLHPVPLSLAMVLKDVLTKFGAIPGAERIRVELDGNLPLVMGDESILQSIFTHLLDNALKYAPEGPVLVETFPGRARLRVQVTDSGPGIPPEKRRLLFQRFQRLEASDSQSVYGHGLGLYLSRRMLRAMKSDLAFEAPPEGGSRFYFYLKVVR